MQMQVALDDKNLGRWAELMQIRTRYLPLDRHPPLGHGAPSQPRPALVGGRYPPEICPLLGLQHLATSGVHRDCHIYLSTTP